MNEPPALSAARAHMARAEAEYMDADGLAELEQGLALLEDIAMQDASPHADVAANLAGSYLSRLHGLIRARIEADRALPETLCEHLFRVLLAFDAVSLPLPDGVQATKIEVARRLIEHYYEGHSAEVKARALDELTALSSQMRGD